MRSVRLSTLRGAAVALTTVLVAAPILMIVSLLVLPAAPADAAGEVTIAKLVNGERADSAPGPNVTSGSSVGVRYLITVTSPEPLYDFVVTDTAGVSPDCDLNGDGTPDGYNGHPGPLANGDRFSCFATETAGAPGVTSASIGRVRAYSFDASQTFEDDAVSHYTTVAPATTAPASTAPPSTQPATTPTTAAPATSGQSSEAATTQTPAEPETSSTFDEQGAPSPSVDSTLSTTLGVSQADPTPSSGSGLSTATAGNGETATARRSTDTAPRSATDAELANDETPSELAFNDDLQFSYLLAAASAAAGGGVAMAGHQLGRRRRDSAPGQARG